MDEDDAGDDAGLLRGGRPGVGGFLWQEYNALLYEHIILVFHTSQRQLNYLSRLSRKRMRRVGKARIC